MDVTTRSHDLLRERAGSTMLRPRRRSTMQNLSNKPAYAPPPPPTVAEESEEPESPRGRSSTLLISGGKVVETNQATPELPTDMRLQILQGVKNKVLTPDEAVSLSTEVAEAHHAGDEKLVASLMERANNTSDSASDTGGDTIVDADQRKIIMRSVANGDVPLDRALKAMSPTGSGSTSSTEELSPQDLAKLDDVSRATIMEGVKNGDMTMDEALEFIRQFLQAQGQAAG